MVAVVGSDGVAFFLEGNGAAGEHFFDIEGGDLFFLGNGADSARAVDPYIMRQRLVGKETGQKRVAGDAGQLKGMDLLHFGEDGCDDTSGLVGNGQELHAAVISALEGIHPGHHGSAWGAPGCPEVQDNELAAELRHMEAAHGFAADL